MASSLEDILINVNNVKKNKCEGSLFLMTQRLAWMPAGKNNFTVSYNYSDIKLQKISPDTKEKVQLQVVLEVGGASTFHFNNPGGRPAQMKDREAVKTLLQESINKFKKNVSSELELKSMILEENPSMFELYKSLVVSGKLTSDEFWASRTNKIQPNKVPQQDIGVSSGFLGEIQGHADGCNGIKYNLTPDIISSIFKTYPAVQRKHSQLVPEWISEQQFWYEFFQSHYFHRDRTNISEKEIFAECAQQDQLALKGELEKRHDAVTIDFGTLYDDSLHADTINDDDVASTSANASLIKRFNQHSSMVLKSSLAEHTEQINDAGDDDANGSTKDKNINNNSVNNNNNNSSDGNNNKNKSHQYDTVDNNNANKRQSLRISGSKAIENSISNIDRGTLDISNGHPAPSLSKRHRMVTETIDIYSPEETSAVIAPKLTLSKTEAYLHGPIPRDCMTYNTSDELFSASEAFKQSVRSWKPTPLQQILTNSAALTVLSELSPSGSLMQHPTASLNVPVLPAEMQEEFRLLQLTLSELLRHFWACFPVTDKILETKAVRMTECLKEFEKSQLENFNEKLLENHLPVDETMENIKNMLAKAHSKYSGWINRKTYKRT